MSSDVELAELVDAEPEVVWDELLASPWLDDPGREIRIAEAEPARRLTYRWWPVDRPAEATDVTIELDPVEIDQARPATIVRVVESPPATGAFGVIRARAMAGAR